MTRDDSADRSARCPQPSSVFVELIRAGLQALIDTKASRRRVSAPNDLGCLSADQVAAKVPTLVTANKLACL